MKRIAKFLDVTLTEQQIDIIAEENTFKNRKKAVGNHFWYNKGKYYNNMIMLGSVYPLLELLPHATM